MLVFFLLGAAEIYGFSCAAFLATPSATLRFASSILRAMSLLSGRAGFEGRLGVGAAIDAFGAGVGVETALPAGVFLKAASLAAISARLAAMSASPVN